jgi:hypothetical protein
MLADRQSVDVATIRDRERRFDRWAWLTLAAGLGLMALALSMVLWAFTIPTDGWWAQQESGGADAPIRLLINQSGQPSPLRENDLILMMNGQRPEEFISGMGPILARDQPFTYLISRAGQEMEIVAPPVRRQPAGIWQVIVYDWRQNPLTTLSPLFFFLIGAFVFLMRPENLGARYLFLVGSYYVCTLWGFADSFFMGSLYPPLLLWLNAWFGGASWAWLFFPLLIQLVLVFPRRIGPMRRWPRLFPLLVHGVPAVMLFAASVPFIRNGDPATLGYYMNDLGVFILVPIILLFLVTLIAGLIYNFRTIHDPVERAQLRWFALGIGLGLGGMVATFLIGGLLDRSNLLTERTDSVSGILMNLLLLCVPLGLGVAILRYRLFDIDVIIRKTLQYTVVTALLLLVYFGAVVVLQQIFTRSLGWDSTPAIVLSTLLIAAMFNPIRRRVQDAVDRRFFRRKYDAEKVLAQFAATARDETDLDALTTELLRVIQETMEPESLSLWLKPTADGRPLTADR